MKVYTWGHLIYDNKVARFKFYFVFILGFITFLLGLFIVLPMLWHIDYRRYLDLPLGLYIGAIGGAYTAWTTLLLVGMITGERRDTMTIMVFKDGSKLFRVIEGIYLLDSNSGTRLVIHDSGLLTYKELNESYPDLDYTEIDVDK